jgi:hypothetical protein
MSGIVLHMLLDVMPRLREELGLHVWNPLAHVPQHVRYTTCIQSLFTVTNNNAGARTRRMTGMKGLVSNMPERTSVSIPPSENSLPDSIKAEVRQETFKQRLKQVRA